MASRSRRSWKQAETNFARRLGTERIPLMGREGSDFETDLLAIEHKVRPATPAWWTEAWKQLESWQTNKVRAIGLTVSKQGIPAQRFLIFQLDEFIALMEKLTCTSSTMGGS